MKESSEEREREREEVRRLAIKGNVWKKRREAKERMRKGSRSHEREIN